MRKIAVFFASVAVIAAVGCSKKVDTDLDTTRATGEAVPVKHLSTSDPEIIPGEKAVKDALVQKEYDVAIQRYTALKQAVATPQQNDEYLSLYGQIRSELTDAADKDPKAREALTTLQVLRNGR